MASKESHLSVVDQNTVRVYIQLFLIFPFPDSKQVDSAVRALADGLQVTLKSFPFLAGTLRLADSKSGKLSLTYPAEIPDVLSSGLLKSKLLPRFRHTYEQLKSDGMPPSAITSQIFCPEDLHKFSGIPCDGEGIVDFEKSDAPVMRIHAFFIDGGLVLGIYTHHSVMDFSGMNKFWEHYAHNVRGLSDPSSTPVLPLPDQSRMKAQLDSLIPRYTQGHLHVESYVNGKFEYLKTLPSGPETARSQRLFVIPAPRIRNFRKNLEGLSGFSISICNIITALVWIHVTRARASRLRQAKFKYDNTSIGISVNLRNRMTPPLPDDYTGNMALYAKATLPIADLLTEQRITNATLLPAIESIKAAINRVNTDWVNQHLAFFKTIDPITDTECALRFGLGPDLYITSWQHFGAQLQWGIPGTASSHPEFVRRAYNPSDGGVNIMPRRRDPTDGIDAPYEVVVRLATEDMERMLAEEGGLSSWAEHVID